MALLVILTQGQLPALSITVPVTTHFRCTVILYWALLWAFSLHSLFESLGSSRGIVLQVYVCKDNVEIPIQGNKMNLSSHFQFSCISQLLTDSF